MKILMLTPYLPYPLVSGGQIRTYNLLKNLKKDHDITLFSLIKEDNDRQYLKDIKPFCHDIKLFRRSTKPFTPRNILKAGLSLYPFVVTRNLVSNVILEVKKELDNHKYDLIHAETFYMMPNIPKTDIPTILVEQTIEYLGYQSFANSTRFWPAKPLLYVDIAKIRYWEKYYWRSCSRLITMSENDKTFIQSELTEPVKIDVVANGVDTDYFDQIPKKLPQEPTIMFVGTFKWLPNIQAATYLVKKVWPLIKKEIPDAKLNIVGFQPTPDVLAFNQLDSVTVNGSVEDIRDAYANAHVLVAPVKWGKGTRYKILEAMATRTPIIATPLAVEGIAGIKKDTHVLLADTPEGLADRTIKALRDETLRQQLATESYKLVSAHYNWAAISKDLDRVYREIGHKS